ncbi:EamA family transporter [Lactobacillus sp. ESL0677]|uniref:EamA family transporter n=1 Tax=Lactobacillus sp. ESL0677 TaxID=2983208 RepID=UPI0023F921E1|nr:EamA family transporter [Lactobacillus sp. ESL0677]WEV36588.1 EamA family transporter [Lactobacillus sp. ESL0677]
MAISNFLLIIFACVSSFSRGIISVIDRYQMGYRKQSSINVNFLNNLCSTALVTVLLMGMLNRFSAPTLTGEYLWHIGIYGLLAQLVAYGYSYVFKKVTIMQSIVLSKMTDLFIPVAIFLTMGYFSQSAYLISIVSTIIVVCYIIFKQRHSELSVKTLLTTFMVIGPLLIVQAALSPLLTKGVVKPIDLIYFTIATIYIRCIITIITFWVKNHSLKFKPGKLTKQVFWIYAARAILTLLAQVTYTLATSSPNSGIAWVFLNMTNLYSVIFGSFALKEKIHVADVLLIICIFGLALLSR